MVVIQCPHCQEDVELDDGETGLFDCPYCNNDFNWDGGLKTNDLKVQFLVFLFSVFSPSLSFIASLLIMSIVGGGGGYAALGYFFISVGICLFYTTILAIISVLKKNKPLSQGIGLSLLVSILTVYMAAEL